MKGFVLTLFCAIAVASVPDLARAQPASRMFGERPPPATEPSVVLSAPAPAVSTAPVVPVKTVPKPIVRRAPVPRPSTAATGPATIPPPEVLLMMVRGVLAGVNQANFTGNYSVLHGLTTPALQARVNEAQFGKAFANLRKQNLDLSPALVLPLQFMETPSMTPQGTLKLAGFVPTRPLQINFAIIYVPVDGVWRIDTLSISALQASAAAPHANSASPAQPIRNQSAGGP